MLPLDRTTLLAHGLRGHVFRSTDDGATWAPIATPQAVLLATAAKFKNGSLVLAGDARTLLVSRDGALTVAPWSAPLATAVAELIETPAGVLALGEAGATLLPAPK